MYRTIDVALWTDPKIRCLPPDGKLLFVYLITNPHTHVSGIYYLPMSVMAHETGIKEPRVDTLLHTLYGRKLVVFDSESEVVWVKNMLDRQGRGSKNNRSAATQLRTLHNCKLINDFLQFYEHRKIPYTIPIPLVNPSCLQEQEQEQEQEQDIKDREPESDNGFADWYAAYPRHTAKGKAVEAYAKAIKDGADPFKLLAAAVEFSDSDQGRGDQQFIPHPATWLNRQQWEDDPAAWKHSNGRSLLPEPEIPEIQ